MKVYYYWSLTDKDIYLTRHTDTEDGRWSGLPPGFHEECKEGKECDENSQEEEHQDVTAEVGLVYGELVQHLVSCLDAADRVAGRVLLTGDVLDPCPLVGHQGRVAVVEPRDELEPGQPGGNTPGVEVKTTK